MKINNRRYIGCKTKLLDFIYDTVLEYNISKGSVFTDIFAGTGVVAYKFAQNDFKVILNDTLYSNFVIYNAIFGKENIRKDIIDYYIMFFNSIQYNDIQDNYFSEIYGGKYFSNNDAKKIGYIRDYIDNIRYKLNQREYYYLVASLIYVCDKIANTVGHFESFLKKTPKDKGVELCAFEIENNMQQAIIYNKDANELSKEIISDVVYIDPPYNARQYVNFYHVLENLARWNKPTEFEGNSMKFKRNELKSDYCRNKAPKLFEDLINNLKCSLIVVSYNNTYKAGSISSVNTISEDKIKEILQKKGKLTIKEIDYKAFSAGKTKLYGHKEYLYICEVE